MERIGSPLELALGAARSQDLGGNQNCDEFESAPECHNACY